MRSLYSSRFVFSFQPTLLSICSPSSRNCVLLSSASRLSSTKHQFATIYTNVESALKTAPGVLFLHRLLVANNDEAEAETSFRGVVPFAHHPCGIRYCRSCPRGQHATHTYGRFTVAAVAVPLSEVYPFFPASYHVFPFGDLRINAYTLTEAYYPHG